MSGKGSSPRPYSVDRKTFENNWDNIFRKDKRVEEDQQNEDEEWRLLEEKQKSKDNLGV
jgi:hypothetical protein